MKNKTITKSINKKQVNSVKKEIPPSQKSLLSKKKKNEEPGKNKPGLKDSATLRKRSTKSRNNENADKYWNILENIHDGCFEVDLSGNFIFLNDSVCRALGYSREELMKMNVRQLSDKEILKKVFQATNEVYKTGKPIKEFGWHVTRKDGAERYIQGSISLRKDSAGNPIGFLVIANDITERKRAEEFIKQSEEKYRLLADHMKDQVWIMNLDLKVTYISPSVEKLMGYTLNELKHLPLDKIITSASFKAAMDFFATEMPKALAAPSDYILNRSLELEVCCKDGHTVWEENMFSFILDDNGKPLSILGEARDITERKLAETQLKQTLDSLKKAVGTTIQVLVSAIESRDTYTAGHQSRSADLARAIATEMGLCQDKIDGIRMAGSIHDIGKLSIPAEILSKPSKLTNIEFSLIKEHSHSGSEMLKDVESPWPLAEIVYQHHERINGSGYPRNLKGDEILIESRILAVADVVEAIASHRPYRPTLGIEAALEEIEKNKGILYDDAVTDTCLKLFREKGYQLK